MVSAGKNRQRQANKYTKNNMLYEWWCLQYFSLLQLLDQISKAMWKSLPEPTVVVDLMENPPRWTWKKTGAYGGVSHHDTAHCFSQWKDMKIHFEMSWGFFCCSKGLLAANMMENLGQNSPNIWARRNVHGKDGLGTHCIPAAGTCCHQCQRKNLETATCHHAKPHKRIQKAHVRKRICSCNTAKDLQGLKDVAVG